MARPKGPSMINYYWRRRQGILPRNKIAPPMVSSSISLPSRLMAALLCSMLLLPSNSLLAFQAVPPVQRNRGLLRLTFSRVYASADSPSDSTIEEQEDWRAFRARLVQQHQQNQPTRTSSATTASKNNMGTSAAVTTRWAHDAGQNVEVGTILLSIPTTDVCQALDEQFWHRGVVLVTERSTGNAGGAWGVMLNRPLSSTEHINYDSSGSNKEGWNTFLFGGGVPGTKQDETDMLCLHSLANTESQAVSQPICHGLSQTSLKEARRLVQLGDAAPQDFYCFQGHCRWDPNQLEDEMGPERREWYAANFDASSIIYELARQQTRPGKNMDMWDRMLRRIDKRDEATSRIPHQQLCFYDRMLQAWMKENREAKTELMQIIDPALMMDKIGPGTLVRSTTRTLASALPPYLLTDQDFHRSIIIVLWDDEEATVGVQLNLVLNDEVGLTDDISLPIRYGGPTYPLGMDEEYDEDEDEDMDEEDDEEMWVWLHRSPTLRKDGIGSPLGNSGFWTVEEDDAVEAILSGRALPKDVMVFGGASIWKKDGLGGGLQEQIVGIGSMEVVSPKKADVIWDLLSSQEALTTENFGTNVNTTIAAWEAAGSRSCAPSEDMLLADAAFRAWVAMATGIEE